MMSLSKIARTHHHRCGLQTIALLEVLDFSILSTWLH
ncbi:hypothetical protein TELCIR_16376 [Teladorsagia circumcincta]|uniref:Uncharacterized protein n=1 Tax=Teladorsagia circumcincta TaxID=45464 RepID=A0A2G9TVN4_TELCI|nr:hypothetical protein TELCIR_16376 [Teladorsagia circumcincta]